MTDNLIYRDPDHATLPHVVKFSGGRSSGMMLFEMLERDLLDAKRGDVIVFNNTSAEHPATYEFVARCRDEVARISDVPFVLTEYWLDNGRRSWREVTPETWRRDGSAFEDMVQSARQLPSRLQRICTDHMKIEVSRKFLASWFASHPATAWQAVKGRAPLGVPGGLEYLSLTGLRHDERRRVDRIVARCKHGEHVYAPLHSWGMVKKDVAAFWRAMPFDLAVSSEYSNCVYCFMKGKRQLQRMARAPQGEGPAGLEWWAAIERDHARVAQDGQRFGFFGKGQQFNHEVLAEIAAEGIQQVEMDCFCTD